MPRKNESFREIWQDVKEGLKVQATILLGFVSLLWLLELVDTFLLLGYLDRFGIRPRQVEGLWGILTAPFLHGGIGHLTANTGPLLVLGWFVMWRRTRDWFVVALIGSVIGGLGVWLVGASNSIHIGASILCFAFLGYLMLRGWFDRRVVPIVGSIVIAVLYGGLLFGVLPGRAGVSWEGHLFGFIGGIVAARLLARGSSSSSATAA
ncbi:MAG TPA: rhomboid family intramembrane serine protease [Polyangiaceae bacterium]|nr:rhomboid family intramembrane serine protease [Polyangiaceae bacterium]